MTVISTVIFFLKSLSIFIATIAIIGNALVCHVIVRLKTMKTSINYIILNLAVLDAISGITTIYIVFLNDKRGVLVEPILEQAYNQSSVLADVMCKLEICYWLPAGISPPLLMLMAYEQYKAIVHPLSRLDNTVSKARLKWMIPLVWLAGLIYVVVFASFLSYDQNQRRCKDKWNNFEIFVIVWLTTQYFIPSTAIIVFYARIICALKREDNALGPQAEVERVRSTAKAKVMRTIIAVTLVFYLFCGVPQVVSVLASTFNPDKLLKWDLIGDIHVLLLSVNFAFNPCVYFIFIEAFRVGIRRLFASKYRA